MNCIYLALFVKYLKSINAKKSFKPALSHVHLHVGQEVSKMVAITSGCGDYYKIITYLFRSFYTRLPLKFYSWNYRYFDIQSSRGTVMENIFPNRDIIFEEELGVTNKLSNRKLSGSFLAQSPSFSSLSIHIPVETF